VPVERGHSLPTHADRGQHRERPPLRGRPLRDTQQRRMPIRNVPVVPRLTDLAVQMTEHGALHTAPGTRGTTPVPIGLGVYHTGPQLTTHRVQLPGVGAAADRLTRIPGQPTVGLRP